MWTNNVILLLMLLFGNQIQKLIPKKLVGVTSVLNPRYNSLLDAIKTSGIQCMQTRQSHRHTMSHWYELSKQNYISKKSKL